MLRSRRFFRLTAAAGRVHRSSERVFTSANTKQSPSRNTKSISPRRLDWKLRTSSFMPRRFKCFAAALSPSRPRVQARGRCFRKRKRDRILESQFFTGAAFAPARGQNCGDECGRVPISLGIPDAPASGSLCAGQSRIGETLDRISA